MVAPARPRARIREIVSPANPLVKVFRRALAQGTTDDGWLAIEGPRWLEEALETSRAGARGLGAAEVAKAVVRSVIVSESGARRFGRLVENLPAEAEIAQVPDSIFAGISQVESPQGIAALVELPPYDLESILRPSPTLLVVACGLQDPGNLGTIMRTAQALGATGLATLPETVSPFNGKAVRASAGAVLHLPIVQRVGADSLFGRLRGAAVCLIAADRRAPTPVTDADLRRPLALLIGREASGLDDSIARRADLRVSIPVRPGTDSVNAAAAAGILMYEAARQRGFPYLRGRNDDPGHETPARGQAP